MASPFGPRYFLAKNMKVYEYLNKILPPDTGDNEFISYVKVTINFIYIFILKMLKE